jgi:hypothetical protein
MKTCAKCPKPKACMAAGKCALKRVPAKKPAAKKKPYGPKKSSSQQQMKGACWKGYEAVGTKQKNGRTVPNCVPKAKKK